MRVPYSELSDTAERVAAVVKSEESNFLDTIDEGLARIEKIFASMDQSGIEIVDGSSAAELYQTYGVPPELFEQMATDRDNAMHRAAQRLTSRLREDVHFANSAVLVLRVDAVRMFALPTTLAKYSRQNG